MDLNAAGTSLDKSSRFMSGRLTKLFARFKPTRSSPENPTRKSHQAADLPSASTMEVAAASGPPVDEVVYQTVNLESHENFSQLMFMASLVKLGPRKGVFEALVEVFDTKTIRVFRNWLSHLDQLTEARAKRQKETISGIDKEPDGQQQDGELVWIDEHTKIARLDVEARELRWKRDGPILMKRDENEALSYSLELKGT